MSNLGFRRTTPAYIPSRESMVYNEMLDYARHKATDERDRICSLLGLLLHDNHRVIEVDYDDIVEILARRTTIHLLRVGSRPEHLNKCACYQMPSVLCREI